MGLSLQPIFRKSGELCGVEVSDALAFFNLCFFNPSAVEFLTSRKLSVHLRADSPNFPAEQFLKLFGNRAVVEVSRKELVGRFSGKLKVVLKGAGEVLKAEREVLEKLYGIKDECIFISLVCGRLERLERFCVEPQAGCLENCTAYQDSVRFPPMSFPSFFSFVRKLERKGKKGKKEVAGGRI